MARVTSPSMHDARDAEDTRLLEAGEHKRLVESYYGVVLDRCHLKVRGDGALDVAHEVVLRLISELARGRRYRVPFRVVVHQVIKWTVAGHLQRGKVVEVELDEWLALGCPRHTRRELSRPVHDRGAQVRRDSRRARCLASLDRIPPAA